MGFLDILLHDGTSRREFEDFADRYDEGPPSEGYTDGEVLSRYGQVAHEVSPDAYEAAAHDALERIPEGDRRELAGLLQQGAGRRGVDPSALRVAPGADPADSGSLAGLLRSLHEQPGLLRDLLGGGGAGTGMPANLGAPAAPEDSPGLGGVVGGILASPAAKAALAGITAMLVRQMLQPKARG
jgi:hypothetical protein